MSNLLSYVQKAMMVASLASSGYSAAQNSSNDRFVFWIGAVFGSISYALIIGGVGLYLTSNYETPVALMVTGLIIILSMLMIILGVRYYKSLRQRRIQKAISSTTVDVANTLSELSDDIAVAFKDNAGVVALAVALMGFITAKKVI